MPNHLKLNAMMDDFSVSPISSIGVLDEIGSKSIRISQVRQDANDKQQIKRFSTNGKEFQLSSYEQPLNDLFGFSEKKFLEEESSGAASINQTFNLKGYDFTSSNSEYKEHAPSDFLQDSRNSLEENDIFEASATSTAGFRHSKGKKRNQHVLWERFDPFNDGSVSNEFRSPAWSLLSKEVPEDNIGLFSEDSASSPAIRTGNNLKFGSLSTENRKSKSKLSGFMADFSQNENLFPGFDETVWQNELSSKSPCEILDGENSFIPFKAQSSLDLFDFAIGADSRSSAYKPESEVDHLNLFKMSKSTFVIPDALESPRKFLYQNNLFEKQLDLNVEHQTPTRHSSKAEGHGEFCKGIHFADFPKQQDDKEDRGSCEKPEAKDYEMKSTSSLNAESAAGIDGLSKVNLDEESKGESLEQSHTKNGHLYGETEVVPTPMEEVPSQLQNYVRDQL
ncbi:hypothetical protein AXF42_Ash008109 [Apostasia shenzhenica]|uniref:Uncharacterized protein n=1 Tax=Apostasia shenzhenica TaxID=1088818 RepID=A0A2I0A8J7_9ASPA|nr:hypothetical protein AXF42_Ash008109 [Apostasia shenzhenica]